MIVKVVSATVKSIDWNNLKGNNNKKSKEFKYNKQQITIYLFINPSNQIIINKIKIIK